MDDEKTPDNVTKLPTKQRLTAKQEGFVQDVLAGQSASDAYRHNYDTSNSKPSSVWTESSKLMANPKVAQRLKAYLARREEAALSRGVSLRTWILDKLKVEAEQADTPMARLKALELLGKSSDVGLFIERIQTESVERSSDEVRTEIERRLTRLLAESE